MAKGFGKTQPTEVDRIVEQIVQRCRERNPESLDRIFDTLHVGLTAKASERLSERIMTGVRTQLETDLDTLGWFCGYMASEINQSEDSDREHLPIATLSKKLVKLGFTAFKDFSPYPGRRIIILATEKFESLPAVDKAEIQAAFDLLERTGEQVWQVNEALRQELGVAEGGDRYEQG